MEPIIPHPQHLFTDVRVIFPLSLLIDDCGEWCYNSQWSSLLALAFLELLCYYSHGLANAAGKEWNVVMEQSTEKAKALEMTISNLTKQFGPGTVIKMGEARARMDIGAIPTGAIGLDLALGIGGIPRGRVTEIFGAESSGKSTLAQHIIAEAQHLGGVAAYIDVEHVLDPTYAARCGVNVDELYISQPDTGEQALEICEALVRSGAVDVVVVDSVAALVPRAEIEGEMGDAFVGLQARLMSQALRKLTASISKSKTAVVFINQLREKIGVMFGSPEVTPGGRALKFYSSVRLDMRRVETIKQGTDAKGIRVRVKVVKNKVAPPFRSAEFDILFNQGISKEGSLLDVGAEMGVIKKSGAFYLFGETRLGQGRDNARQFLQSNPEVLKEVEAQIRSNITSFKGAAAAPSEEAESAET